ncbi:spermatogenesis-associated protein 9 isoform X4 [Heterocephalus glaber]|uniref:Spermatogenesis-associated protein 9 isoform X4 n=1 Tax=Heterocephalus glaber TaxID=10181 RepID=A0AAX6P1Z1_HETGA|nr:spermatogenesis-associated protein 9 isoform X4 [Heterocephalus glaber]
MPIRHVVGICGQVLKNFSGRIEGIQKVIMDLMDEFKDDFPTVLGLSQSNQEKGPEQKSPGIRTAATLARINRGALVRGLSSLSLTCQALAGLLRPGLARCLLDLRARSRPLLGELHAARPRPGPDRGQAICVNAVLEKRKKISEEEEVIRQNRESENSRKAFSEPVLSEPMFPEGEIKAKPYRSLPEKPDISYHPKLPANEQKNKIQVLHSVFDWSAEMNEQI